jgi:hypothetical protein
MVSRARNLEHINLRSLARLSGLSDERMNHAAEVLDNTIRALMEKGKPQAEHFQEWRRLATFTSIQPTDFNFSFRIYQLVSPKCDFTTVISVDGGATDGTPGHPRRGAHVYCYLGAAEGQEIISIPLVYLLREHGTIEGHHVLYEHGAVDYSTTATDVFKNLQAGTGSFVPMPAAAHASNGLVYIGITSRDWTTRFREHLQATARGSQLPFHRALRDDFATCNTRFHYVLMLLPSKEKAEDAEEQFVAQRSLFPKGLNAIPGGRAGIRFLASINALKPREEVAAEDAENHLAEFLTAHPDARAHDPYLQRLWSGERPTGTVSAGPRPEMARFWADHGNAARLITSRADRLSIAQIRNARYSAAIGLTPGEIAAQIGAKDAGVVRRLLDGKTYKRVQ